MSFLTCFWLFPQKLHLSRSPPSPIRATSRVLQSRREKAPALHTLRCAALQWAVRRYPAPAPDGGRTRDVVGHHFRADPVVSAVPQARTGAPLRDSMTASIRPYSTACSAVRILSRSMSRLTWSMSLPLESAI